MQPCAQRLQLLLAAVRLRIRFSARALSWLPAELGVRGAVLGGTAIPRAYDGVVLEAVAGVVPATGAVVRVHRRADGYGFADGRRPLVSTAADHRDGHLDEERHATAAITSHCRCRSGAGHRSFACRWSGHAFVGSLTPTAGDETLNAPQQPAPGIRPSNCAKSASTQRTLAGVGDSPNRPRASRVQMRRSVRWPAGCSAPAPAEADGPRREAASANNPLVRKPASGGYGWRSQAHPLRDGCISAGW